MKYNHRPNLLKQRKTNNNKQANNDMNFSKTNNDPTLK